MSLRNEITADIAEAFSTDLADAVSEFTGSRIEATGPYDPITQEQETETIVYSGRGVLSEYSTKESEELNILRTDIELTALQAEVSAAPKIDDEITSADVTYKVIHVGQDPASATWSLQLRTI